MYVSGSGHTPGMSPMSDSTPSQRQIRQTIRNLINDAMGTGPNHDGPPNVEQLAEAYKKAIAELNKIPPSERPALQDALAEVGNTANANGILFCNVFDGDTHALNKWVGDGSPEMWHGISEALNQWLNNWNNRGDPLSN